MVTILRYVPREYMPGNSKTRETALNGPVVDREARGEIPKNAMCAIPKIVMIISSLKILYLLYLKRKLSELSVS